MSTPDAILNGPGRVRCGSRLQAANISRKQCAHNQLKGKLDPYGPCATCRNCDNPGKAPMAEGRFVPRADNGMCHHTRASRKAREQGEPLLIQERRSHLQPPKTGKER